jgi:hypothetical protein
VKNEEKVVGQPEELQELEDREEGQERRNKGGR